MIYRRCPNRDHPEGVERFYPKRDGACPACGDAFEANTALVKSKLNNHLFGQLNKQRDEVRFARDARHEREPG